MVIQHVDYWDQDGDGIIWPLDTYHGCRAFGWNLVLALVATFLINGALSYPTVPGWLPDPFFRIYTARMYKDKHGSDSMTYDNEGRFRPQNFEDIFAKYDRGNKGGLDLSDLWDFWKGQRMVFDFFGWSATFFECAYISVGEKTPMRIAGRVADCEQGWRLICSCGPRTASCGKRIFVASTMAASSTGRRRSIRQR